MVLEFRTMAWHRSCDHAGYCPTSYSSTIISLTFFSFLDRNQHPLSYAYSSTRHDLIIFIKLHDEFFKKNHDISDIVGHRHQKTVKKKVATVMDSIRQMIITNKWRWSCKISREIKDLYFYHELKEGVRDIRGGNRC